MSQEIPATPVPSAEPEKKSNTGKVILIIVAILLVICCLCAVVILAVPSLLGPSIGNVFSNIIEGLGTPMP
jgi:Flp pilus assembly pilin Flp